MIYIYICFSADFLKKIFCYTSETSENRKLFIHNLVEYQGLPTKKSKTYVCIYI